MMKIGIKRLLIGAVLAASLTAALSTGALAADYRFAGAAGTEYYPSTCYEDVYGAQYQFGGMNAVELECFDLPYGFSGVSAAGTASANSAQSAQNRAIVFIRGRMNIPPGLSVYISIQKMARKCKDIPATIYRQ